MSDTPYENLDIGYYEFPLPTTEEFQTVRFLNKEGLARLWGKVNEKFLRPVSGGEPGQVLTKIAGGYAWQDANLDLPDVIPVAQGGTGCTTVEGIRTMLFNFPTESQVDEYFGFE